MRGDGPPGRRRAARTSRPAGRAGALGPTVAAAALLAGFVLLTGCSQKNAAEETAVAATDSITGTVRQVGSTPFTRLVVEGEESSVQITGSLEDEIRRLVGARVRVVGAPAESEEAGRALEAARYEILSVDGATPRVGTLRHEAGRGYRLVTGEGETISLRGVPETLGARVGAKVWMVLGEEGGVQRYGVIREAEGTEGG